VVLTRTFQHVPRIGPQTERRLWRGGFVDWQGCLARVEEVPLGPVRRRLLAEFLRRSLAALSAEDAGFFARSLPRSEMWRLFAAFRHRAVFLDIETTGMGGPGDVVTLVGLYDGEHPRVFIRGINMAGLQEALRPFSLIVTYNGAQFDLPFLRWAMPEVTVPPAHLDLRFPLARLGYRGGLKGVEQQVGLDRHPWIAGLTGFDAVVLWQQYQAGSRDALRRLVAYNLADVLNLESLAAFLYNEMVLYHCQEGGLAEAVALLALPTGNYDESLREAYAQVRLG
jgi:uncharacterized protein YprB with RNaseH-like and TPR domain